MTLKQAGNLFQIVLTILLLAEAYGIGRVHGREALREEQVCGCYQREACSFAPGVIGVRECTGSLRWGKCEPDPRYRVEAP